METKETLLRSQTETTLAHNEDYFKHIFKKTEKIACAVFLITRSRRDIDTKDSIVRDLEDTSQRLIDVSLCALRATYVKRHTSVQDLSYTLIELESKLRVFHSALFIPTEHLNVFIQEIDSVQRSLKKYIVEDYNGAGSEYGQTSLTRKRLVHKVTTLLGEESSAGQASSGAGTRTERILTFLKDKNDATIKDIAEVITDCSEKTIQRELTSLIKDGIIVREGERRWSKYKLI